MACIRKRRGRYVVDYRDHLGIRRTPGFDTKKDADEKLADVLRQAGRERRRLTVDRDITIEEYAAHWLAAVRPTVEESTYEGLEANCRLHIVPVLGPIKVRKLQRGAIKNLLTSKMSSLSRDTVRLILATLRSMLGSARRDDELIREDLTLDMAKMLRLSKHRGKVETDEEMRAFTREQRDHFLDTLSTADATLHPLVFALSRTGMRIGEALALRWADVDLDAAEIRIRQAVSRGRLKAPKTLASKRTIDMSPELVSVLRPLQLSRPGEYVFSSEAGTMLDVSNVRKRFDRVLRLAKLKGFSPHSLRHTYASLLFQEGESPTYVQQQMGHSSIKITVDLYGRWLRRKPLIGVGVLDRTPEKNGSFSGLLVATATASGPSDDTQNSDAATVGWRSPRDSNTQPSDSKSQARQQTRTSDVSLSHGDQPLTAPASPSSPAVNPDSGSSAVAEGVAEEPADEPPSGESGGGA